MATLNFSRGWR